MAKTFVGPQLRQLRRERKQTQAEMAQGARHQPRLCKPAREQSAQPVGAAADGAWPTPIRSTGATSSTTRPRTCWPSCAMSFAIRCSPAACRICRNCARPSTMRRGWSNSSLSLYGIHRTTLERIMRQGASAARRKACWRRPAEAVIHDFFRNHSNYFHRLEIAAEQLRAEEPCEADDIYAVLKARLFKKHGIRVRRRAVEEMTQALRVYDRGERIIHLSEALDHRNRVFQMAHVLCLIELQDLLDELTAESGIHQGHKPGAMPRRTRQLFRGGIPDALRDRSCAPPRAPPTTSTASRRALRSRSSRPVTASRRCSGRARKAFRSFFCASTKPATSPSGSTRRRSISPNMAAPARSGTFTWRSARRARSCRSSSNFPTATAIFTISRTADRPAVNFETQDHRLAVALGCELQYAEQARLCRFVQSRRSADVQPDRHQLPSVPAAGLLAACASAGVHGVAARHHEARQHPIRKLAYSAASAASRRTGSARRRGST